MSNSEYKSDKIKLLTRRTQDDFKSSSSEESLWHLSGEKVYFNSPQDFVLTSLYYILNHEREFLAYGVDHALNFYKEIIHFNAAPTEHEVDMCIGQLKEKPNLIENKINSWCLHNSWDNVIILNETNDFYELIFWETTA